MGILPEVEEGGDAVGSIHGGTRVVESGDAAMAEVREVEDERGRGTYEAAGRVTWGWKGIWLVGTFT